MHHIFLLIIYYYLFSNPNSGIAITHIILVFGEFQTCEIPTRYFPFCLCLDLIQKTLSTINAGFYQKLEMFSSSRKKKKKGSMGLLCNNETSLFSLCSTISLIIFRHHLLILVKIAQELFQAAAVSVLLYSCST